MKKPLPIATRSSQSPTSTTWAIKFPPKPNKDCAFYWATTYPDSDFVYVTTGARRRPISKNVGRKLVPTIKSAIAAALAMELALDAARADR